MELADNFVQFSVTLLGFCLSGMRYLKGRKQAYFLLTCFYGCFALGSLYWTLHLFLFSKTPQVFYVSEFGWVASVIFLSILQYSLSSAEERGFVCRRARIAFLIGVPLCIFYCTFGDILSNLALVRHDDCCFLSCDTGAYLCADADGSARQLRYFHIGVLCYVAAEYILWTSGCFRQGDSASFLYYGFDVLLTGCIFALLPATGRAVQA